MRCWVLPDVCLELLPVPDSSAVYDDMRSNTMGTAMYRKRRPFRLHVAGMPPAELQAAIKDLNPHIKDPLNSQLLRHLERDVLWADRGSASSSSARPAWPLFPPGDGDELFMLWPTWEKGCAYGSLGDSIPATRDLC